MYFLLGNSQMETGDHEGSIQSFEYARARMQHHTSQPLFVVSLVCIPMGKLHYIAHRL